MKSVVELAGEFIEGLILGDIESYTRESVRDQSRVGFEVDQINANIKTLRESIQMFLTTTSEPDRIGAAQIVLENVVFFRLTGMVKNNPNTVKNLIEQRDLYRERYQISEKENEDLHEKNVNLTEALRVEVEKTGVPGTA